MTGQIIVGKPAINLSGKIYVMGVSVTKKPQSGKKIELKLFDLYSFLASCYDF